MSRNLPFLHIGWMKWDQETYLLSWRWCNFHVYHTISLRWADTSKSVAKFVAKRCSLLDVKLHTFCGYMTSCSCMFLQLIMSSTNSRDKLTLESSDWSHTWFVLFNTASKTEARQDDCSRQNLTFDCLEMFWKRGEHEYHIYWNSDHMWYKKSTCT